MAGTMLTAALRGDGPSTPRKICSLESESLAAWDPAQPPDINRAQRGHGPAQVCTAREWHGLAPILGSSCTLTSLLRWSRQEGWPSGARGSRLGPR